MGKPRAVHGRLEEPSRRAEQKAHLVTARTAAICLEVHVCMNIDVSICTQYLCEACHREFQNPGLFVKVDGRILKQWQCKCLLYW